MALEKPKIPLKLKMLTMRKCSLKQKMLKSAKKKTMNIYTHQSFLMMNQKKKKMSLTRPNQPKSPN